MISRTGCRAWRKPNVRHDMPSPARSVVVVDDDESVREALPPLLGALGFEARAYASALAFLAADGFERAGCLILDIAMPGMSGPDLQRELARRGQDIPIVFVTAHMNDAVCQRLLQQGAVACLLKPFSDTALMCALNDAFR